MGSKLIYGQRRRAKLSAYKFSTIGQLYQVRIYHPIEPSRYLREIGDPTDTSIKLRPLEPASGQALARDLVLKTRRRKGLGDQIAVSKYLDDEFVVCNAISLFFSLVNHSFAAGFIRVRTRRPTWLNLAGLTVFSPVVV